MPTPSPSQSIERLNGLIECLEAILDSPGHVNAGALTFLATEIRQTAIEISKTCQQGSQTDADT